MSNLQAASKQLDQYIQQKMRQRNIPGMMLALTDREHTLRISSYGFADLASQEAIMPDTLLEIGSITKSFTSVAVLQQQAAQNASTWNVCQGLHQS